MGAPSSRSLTKPLRPPRTLMAPLAVALNMNITYISPPSKGERLCAEAREINRTNRTALYDIKVLDRQNRLIATCQALVYRTGKPLPFLTEENRKEVS